MQTCLKSSWPASQRTEAENLRSLAAPERQRRGWPAASRRRTLPRGQRLKRPQEISKSAVDKLARLHLWTVLLSHHSCERLPPLPTKRGGQQGSIPVLTEVMLWSRPRKATNHGETMRRPPPGGLYRTSVKRSSAGAAFLCIVLVGFFFFFFYNLIQTSKSYNVFLKL